MSSKALVYLSITIFSSIGSWVGELIGHSWFGLWSIALGVVGCFLGIWVWYKIHNY